MTENNNTKIIIAENEGQEAPIITNSGMELNLQNLQSSMLFSAFGTELDLSLAAPATADSYIE